MARGSIQITHIRTLLTCFNRATHLWTSSPFPLPYMLHSLHDPTLAHGPCTHMPFTHVWGPLLPATPPPCPAVALWPPECC